jgi:hypothetical protein
MVANIRRLSAVLASSREALERPSRGSLQLILGLILGFGLGLASVFLLLRITADSLYTHATWLG